MPTVKPILLALSLSAAATSAFAQIPAQSCLHGADETTANRGRRQQAIQYVARVNAAETGLAVGPGLAPRYRPLSDLTNLPAVPAGFEVQFHTDGRTYTISLKDTRDACHYAIFSDQEKRVYEAIPRKSEVTLVPLGTK